MLKLMQDLDHHYTRKWNTYIWQRQNDWLFFIVMWDIFKLNCSIFRGFFVVLYRSFSLFLSAIILVVPLRLTASNYPFRIFKGFLGRKQVHRENNKWYCTEMILISDCHNSWQIYNNNFASKGWPPSTTPGEHYKRLQNPCNV